MKKAAFLSILVIVVQLAVGVKAEAQQPGKVPLIGYLSGGSANPANMRGFRQGLDRLGYVDGKNITIDSRYGEGKLESLPEFAADFVRLKANVIVTGGTPATLAAKNATKVIPIIFASVADPIGSGMVSSFAKPEGNLTGFSTMNAGVSTKRLELLKEAFPKVSRVAVLWQPDDHSDATNKNMLRESEDTARALKLQLQILETRGFNDFDRAFSAMAKEHADALFVLPSGTFISGGGRKRIVELAAKHRIPAIYTQSEYVDNGGLMSYAANFTDQYYRVAVYVDKILKGAKPTDLPVEQPRKFEFIINLKAAQQIGVTIPQSVLYQADRVIK